MIKLGNSQVVFDPVGHTYTLDGRKLQGITHVIKDRLFPDEYKNVPAAVLARAAERGHRVHTILEVYDNLGIYTHDCEELDKYIQMMGQYPWLRKHIASEYIVSDGKQYASGIDKVYESPDGGVILADIKTTYKIPIDYVTWQLSVYKYFFNIMNPDIPVKGGYVLWARGDKFFVVEVDFKSEEQVRQLLYGDTAPELHHCEIDEDKLLSLKKAADEAIAALEEYKQQILVRMSTNNVQKFDGSQFTISYRAATKRKSFDSKMFKKFAPAIYEQYVVESETKPTISIRWKNG